MVKMQYFLVIYCLSFCSLKATINEILPTYHWSYRLIESLQSRGYCLDLYQMTIPYSRGEIAKSLIEEYSKIKNEFDNTQILKSYKKLAHEFVNEIKLLKSDSVTFNQIQFRSNLNSCLDKSSDKVQYRGIYRGGIGVNWGQHVFAFSGVNFNQYDYHDPNYKGYKWRGVSGYTEQAYINIQLNRFQFKIGRDFLKWGIGEAGTLILSNISHPLDHFLACVRFGKFKWSFIFSQLDPYKKIITDSLDLPVNRYLSGHRLDAAFFNNKLQFAVTELILYGGVTRNIDLTYLNPVIFYHGAHKNKNDDTNVLPTLDILFYPFHKLNLYGSVLIDDIQVEKTGPGDLEPNEIAWLTGIKWVDPINLYGTCISFEYVKTPNRTYKTIHTWETFIHRSVPLGHPLGNDFDHWQVDVSQWVGANLRLKLDYSMTRRGEGSLFTPFDTPWMDYTVEEGYSEPFPTGVVEKQKQLGVEIRFYPSIHWGIQAEAHWHWKENADHLMGIESEGNQWRIGIWFDGDLSIHIKE